MVYFYSVIIIIIISGDTIMAVLVMGTTAIIIIIITTMVIMSTIMESLRPRLPDDDPELRLTTAVTHIVGIAIGRYILRVPPLAEASLEDLVALIAPSVQHYLTGSLHRG